MSSTVWISRVLGVFTSLVLIYSVIAFAVRYRKHRHHVALFGLIGSTVTTLGILGSQVIRLIPNSKYAYCDLKLGLVFYLVGSGVGLMFLTLQYLKKARIMYVHNEPWTNLQRICLAVLAITPFPYVVAPFIIPVGPYKDSCSYEIEAWFVATAAVLIIANNLLPTLCFISPLIKCWDPIVSPTMKNATAGSATHNVSVIAKAITSGNSALRQRSRSATSDKGHGATDLEKLPESGPLPARREAIQRQQQARLIRRVFIASAVSATITLGLTLVIVGEIGGRDFVNNLYAVDSASSWFWAVYALPLPQETNTGNWHDGSDAELAKATGKAERVWIKTKRFVRKLFI